MADNARLKKIMGFQAPNVSGYGNGGGGGPLGFLSSLVGGLHDQNVDRRANEQLATENKLKDQEYTFKNKELENNIKLQDMNFASAAKAGAAADYETLGKQFLTNPELAKDPAMIQRYLEKAKAADIVPHVKPDGTIDMEAIKPKQWALMSTDEQEAFWKLPKGPLRDQAAQSIGNVPKEAKDAPQFMTPHDQAELLKAQADMKKAGTGVAAEARKTKHESYQELMGDKRFNIYQKLAYAKINLSQAEVGKVAAEISHLNMETAAIPQRLSIQVAHLQQGAQRLDLALKTYDQNFNPASTRNLMTSIKDIQTNLHQAESAHQSALDVASKYITARGGTDSSVTLESLAAGGDTTAVKLKQSLDLTNQQIYESKRLEAKATNSLSGMVNQSRSLSAQSGGRKVTVQSLKSSTQVQEVFNGSDGYVYHKIGGSWKKTSQRAK